MNDDKREKVLLTDIYFVTYASSHAKSSQKKKKPRYLKSKAPSSEDLLSKGPKGKQSSKAPVKSPMTVYHYRMPDE